MRTVKLQKEGKLLLLIYSLTSRNVSLSDWSLIYFWNYVTIRAKTFPPPHFRFYKWKEEIEVKILKRNLKEKKQAEISGENYKDYLLAFAVK